MGDIADMMLDGTLCECCGCFIDDAGGGFPRYCSPQCAGDRGVAQPKPKKKKPKKTIPKLEAEAMWPEVSRKIKELAEAAHLTIEWRNPGHPHYEIAFLRGEGIRLCVYPHTTRSTGNQHARIRDQSSPNKSLARVIMIASGFTVKEGGLPELPQ